MSSGPYRDERRAGAGMAAWAIAIAYLLAARGVGNFFPLSAFGMYQGRSPDVASRVLVVGASGEAAEITAFDGFSCAPAWPKLDDVRHCAPGDQGRVEYVSRDLQVYLDAHVTSDAAGMEDARIVWRTWTLEDRPGPPASQDCELASCRVRRRAP
ncbi:hypothetical protein [Polyangium sp. y55x31]|uniref:hypothetical protein n=1 Tax=Polyangium sp. y55x31 TaxID=3042688 RepID=UPI002482E1A7|nr:hypothetical protein [Polyangium sp. y55x31]MDI1478676.1 hypothetical protein [Polyangium sp. y55x31]